MTGAVDVRRLYLSMRRRVRDLVLRYPALDLAVGRTLVKLDVLLRRTGLVSVMDRNVDSVAFRGLRFRFDPRNRDLAETISATGEYEAETLDAVLELLRPGGTFVDLGANIGFFTLIAADAIGPAGRVHGFEPTPATAAILRENVSANGFADRVTVVEAAVASHPSIARFAMFSSAQANSLAVETDRDAELIDVEVTSLDVYFERLGWPKIDLVKMDVEGQERDVFAGMHALVARCPDIRVIFEFHRGQLQRTGQSGRDLIEAARDAGFDTFEVLFRTRQRVDLPREMATLERLSERANVNVMAWRTRTG